MRIAWACTQNDEWRAIEGKHISSMWGVDHSFSSAQAVGAALALEQVGVQLSVIVGGEQSPGALSGVGTGGLQCRFGTNRVPANAHPVVAARFTRLTSWALPEHQAHPGRRPR